MGSYIDSVIVEPLLQVLHESLLGNLVQQDKVPKSWLTQIHPQQRRQREKKKKMKEKLKKSNFPRKIIKKKSGLPPNPMTSEV